MGIKKLCEKCNNEFSLRGGCYQRHVNVCDGSYKRFVKLTNCTHCNLDLSTTTDRANHVKWCSENPNRKPNKNKTPQKIPCVKCGTLFENVGRRTTCSNKCAYSPSEEARILISEKRKKYLSENPDKHPWKRDRKKVSVPCENVKNYLRQNGIDFVEELSPLSDRLFSIDIAFPHLMIGIEVNGNQHYNSDGSLKAYYQERHDLIEQAGWRLIEVHYTECFSNEQIAKFLDFDIPYDNTEKIQKYFEELNKSKELDFCGPRLPHNEKIKRQTDAKWEPIKDKIFDFGIDFSKLGWVTEVSKILEIPTQNVKKWMKRYHSDFYENYCYKRTNAKNSQE